MNYNSLVKALAKLEGKKQEVNIAQIREIVSCLAAKLSEMDGQEMGDTIDALLEIGLRKQVKLDKAKLRRKKK